MICDEANINVRELINLANKHPRVNILQPGCGVGGHCIAVDPWFIVSDFPTYSTIIKQARETNVYKTKWVVDKISESSKTFTESKNRQPRIAILGLAFKPNIDDLRESPALQIYNATKKVGWDVYAVEPNIESGKPIETLAFDEALKKCDIIVILVAHTEFLHLNDSNLNDSILLNFAF
jgi:UDP-N-acetyl-D-mannosaminuronic acid dehydrogenase